MKYIGNKARKEIIIMGWRQKSEAGMDDNSLKPEKGNESIRKWGRE